MDYLFARFFADTAAVCGHEKTLHANFMHQLLMDGVPRDCIAREHADGDKRIDLVVHANRSGDRWLARDDAVVAFEFKGGAYNVRNALHDTIDSEGYCADMDKLATLRRQGAEAWFVCVDMAELGLALSPRQQQRVAGQCARRGVHFAYYAQGADHCVIARPGTKPVDVALACGMVRNEGPVRWQDCLPELASLLNRADVTEDTVTGFIYHALQRAGVGTNRLSLETYFNCAAQGTRMHQRPDLCVFGDRVGGRFNLYRSGDRRRPNDGIKIGDLQAVIEVKSSANARRVSAAAFAKKIAADIDKLVWWRERLGQARLGAGYADVSKPDYVMIAVDNSQSSLAPSTLDDLRHHAAKNSVHFHYLKVAHNEKA
ncbi:hypothetical protein ACEN9H_08750 [Massilia cellulosiltytica]|uniref:hypothetical protein n=1 Tax=Massilia cellulosiltytica TaxID=2683234 RepID=UPI0039B478C4